SRMSLRGWTPVRRTWLVLPLLPKDYFWFACATDPKTDDGDREGVCFRQILLFHGLKLSVSRVSSSPNGNESPLPGSPAHSVRFCENLSMKLRACSAQDRSLHQSRSRARWFVQGPGY